MTILFNGLFCDDVRHEIGNKYTLVGCYGKVLFIPELPSKLNRLCVHFTIQIIGESLISTVKIDLLRNGDPINKIEFDLGPEEQDSNPKNLINGGFDILDLEFEEESELSLLATIDGQPFQGPSLDIKLMPNENPNK